MTAVPRHPFHYSDVSPLELLALKITYRKIIRTASIVLIMAVILCTEVAVVVRHMRKGFR